MRHETVLSLDYESETDAERVERAIAPEIGAIDDDRSRATLDRDRTELTITVAAADLVALRAGCNTWLSLLGVADAAGDAV